MNKTIINNFQQLLELSGEKRSDSILSINNAIEVQLFEKKGTGFFIGKKGFRNIWEGIGDNLVIEGNNSKILINISHCEENINIFAFLKSSGLKLRNLNIKVIYTGDPSNRSINLIYNKTKSCLIKDCSFDFYLDNPINITAIKNAGDVDTHMETPADGLAIENCHINIFNKSLKAFDTNILCGISNNRANSVSISNNYVFVKNIGAGSSQQAIGIYNNGRFLRVNNNNIKANGSHNQGKELEQCSATAVFNEGLYMLLTGNNIVGEWGGTCVGLDNRGAYAKIEGNKILATHTIKGRSVKSHADKCIISNNILTSTSRNPRILEIGGRNNIITGNLMDALLGPLDCKSGCGIYGENLKDSIISNNSISGARDCGIFLKNSLVQLSTNIISGFSDVALIKETADETDVSIESALSENNITSISI